MTATKTTTPTRSAPSKPGGRVLLTVSCTVEIEGEDKPAVVADVLSLMLPDPQHVVRGDDA